MPRGKHTSDNPTDTLPEQSIEAGTVLAGRYRVLERLNVGGMGEVYRGLDQDTATDVAIKVIVPELAQDAKITRLFDSEAAALKALSHDSIVRFHAHFWDQDIGRPCLVMEFVDGRRLTTRLRDGPLPENDVRDLLRRLAQGLGQAHQMGMVHRDLSPNNVLLPDGDVERAKIVDFGIVGPMDDGKPHESKDKFAGTLDFVAPEQLGDYEGAVDGRADIYALGLLGAACCRGQIIDMGSSAIEAVKARREVPDISDVYPALHPILTHMLAPDPGHRPQNMEEVVGLLDRPRHQANGGPTLGASPDVISQGQQHSSELVARETAWTTPPTSGPAVETDPQPEPTSTPPNGQSDRAKDAPFQLPAKWIVAALIAAVMVGAFVLGLRSR